MATYPYSPSEEEKESPKEEITEDELNVIAAYVFFTNCITHIDIK